MLFLYATPLPFGTASGVCAASGTASGNFCKGLFFVQSLAMFVYSQVNRYAVIKKL